MAVIFYLTSILAIIATLLVVVTKNAVHALLYLIVSFLGVSVVLFILGAPFIAALEVIIYAGAIMVLFVFVVMMLNVSDEGIKKEHALLKFKLWIGPSIISFILLVEMVYLLMNQSFHATISNNLSPTVVGESLFTTYSLIVELAAFLLLAGIIGAYQLAEKETVIHHRYLKKENQNS